MKSLLLPVALLCAVCCLNAQESMKMISYYPTAYAQYKNIQTNTVDINPGGGGGSLSADNVVLDTLDVDGTLNTTETSLLETKKVEVGNTLDAGGTLDIAGELRLNKSLDKVISVKAKNTYLVDTPTLDSNVFPYTKAIDPDLEKMVWRPIKYKSGTETLEHNFLALDIDMPAPSEPPLCTITQVNVNCGTSVAACGRVDVAGNNTGKTFTGTLGARVEHDSFESGNVYYDLFSSYSGASYNLASFGAVTQLERANNVDPALIADPAAFIKSKVAGYTDSRKCAATSKYNRAMAGDWSSYFESISLADTKCMVTLGLKTNTKSTMSSGGTADCNSYVMIYRKAPTYAYAIYRVPIKVTLGTSSGTRYYYNRIDCRKETVTEDADKCLFISVTGTEGTYTIAGKGNFYKACNGERITLSATPASGYRFDRWSYGTPRTSSSSNSLTLTVDEALAAKAGGWGKSLVITGTTYYYSLEWNLTVGETMSLYVTRTSSSASFTGAVSFYYKDKATGATYKEGISVDLASGVGSGTSYINKNFSATGPYTDFTLTGFCPYDSAFNEYITTGHNFHSFPQNWKLVK